MDSRYGFSLDVGALLKKESTETDSEEKKVEKDVEPPQKAVSIDPRLMKRINVVFIISIIVVAGVLLSQTQSLSMIDASVREASIAHYREAAAIDISRNNPHLSIQERLHLLEVRVAEFVQSPAFKERIKASAEQYKRFYRYESGQTFLYSADPYYFFRLASNLEDSGILGTGLEKKYTGVMGVVDGLRDAPHGDHPGINVLPHILLYFFSAWRAVIPSVSLLTATFYFPVFVGILSCILLFFIAKKLTDSFGAFITTFIFSVHPVFLFWNYAGYTDTHVIALFWFLLSVFLFLNVLDWSNKILAITSTIMLFGMLLFSKYIWTGLFIIPLLFLVYGVVFVSIFCMRQMLLYKNRLYFVVIVGILLSGGFSVYYFGEPYHERVLVFLNLKEVSELFPTAFGGVSELQGAQTLSRFIGPLGGPVFVLAFFVELFIFIKRLKKETDKTVLVPFVWFAILVVPAFLSVRFLFFLLPAFILVVGRSAWRLCRFIEYIVLSVFRLDFKPLSVRLLSILLIAGISIVLLNPNPFVAKTKPPLVTQSMVKTADYIKANSLPDAVVATWWDSGYAWQMFARRATFFDGGLFRTSKVYWAARMFSAKKMSESANILKIMNCGSDGWALSNFDSWSRNKSRNFAIFDELLSSDTIDTVKFGQIMGLSVNKFYCNRSNEVFVIVTPSMLYQSPAYIHYAQWDFVSAKVRQEIQGLSPEEAVARLMANFSLSEDDALKSYYDAQSYRDEITPKEVSAISSCSLGDRKMVCGNGFVIDMPSLNAVLNGVHPHSLIFVTDGKRTVVTYKDSPVNFSLIVYSTDTGYRSFAIEPDMADMLLVRMFSGENIDGFEKVFVSPEMPDRIVVYKL